MSTVLAKKTDCCGCSACANSCPVKCIEMIEDEEGFLYPRIDESRCISCGKCERICPSKKVVVPKIGESQAYSCRSLMKEIVMESSSGGVFSVLAAWILARKGMVYGAAFDENAEVHHICVDVVKDLQYLRGSKYIQSRMEHCFQQVKGDLQEGREVLFSGTPCQIVGLKAFLEKDYENLYCVDVICHGVPSPMIWRKYIDFLEKKIGAKRIRESFPTFRAKHEGWERFSVSIPFGHDTEYRMEHRNDLFMKTFLKNIILRPSCYECKHRPIQANADITLADFWGIQKVDSEMYDSNGVSLLITHSEKGQRLFENVQSELIWKKEDLEESVKYNHSYFQSCKLPKNRDAFFEKIDKEELGQLMERMTKDSLKRRVIVKIKKAVKRFVVLNK